MSCTTGTVIFDLSSLIITPVSSYAVIFVASCQLFITPARFEGSLGQRLKTKLGLDQGCLTTENTWVRFQLNHLYLLELVHSEREVVKAKMLNNEASVNCPRHSRT